LDLGVTYGKSSSFAAESILVGDQRVHLQYLEGEEMGHQEELGEMLFSDCYGLRRLAEHPKTILDIGGNAGLFSIVARARFPDAVIHCYEPNPELAPIIANNLRDLNIELFHDAVGPKAGKASMFVPGPSGTGRTKEADDGEVDIVAIDTALERLGSECDLLKLDCEGAEWALLDLDEPWQHISALTMEYHLWHGDHTMHGLVSRLSELGFHLDHLAECHTGFNGMLRATRGTKGEFAR